MSRRARKRRRIAKARSPPPSSSVEDDSTNPPTLGSSGEDPDSGISSGSPSANSNRKNAPTGPNIVVLRLAPSTPPPHDDEAEYAPPDDADEYDYAEEGDQVVFTLETTPSKKRSTKGPITEDILRFRQIVFRHLDYERLKARLKPLGLYLEQPDVDREKFIALIAECPQSLTVRYPTMTTEFWCEFDRILASQVRSTLARIFCEYSKEETCSYSLSSLVSMINARFRGGAWAFASRGEESRFLENDDVKSQLENWFLELCGVVIPKDVILYIMEFIPHDYSLVTGFGLCSWSCYIAVLTSWRTVYVKHDNLYFVSKVILRSARILLVGYVDDGVRDALKGRDWRYLIEATQNFQKITLLVIYSHPSFFFTALRQRDCQKTFPNLREFRTVCVKKPKFPAKLSWNHLFPNLETLVIPSSPLFLQFFRSNVMSRLSKLKFVRSDLSDDEIGIFPGSLVEALACMPNLQSLRRLVFHDHLDNGEMFKAIRSLHSLQDLSLFYLEKVSTPDCAQFLAALTHDLPPELNSLKLKGRGSPLPVGFFKGLFKSVRVSNLNVVSGVRGWNKGAEVDLVLAFVNNNWSLQRITFSPDKSTVDKGRRRAEVELFRKEGGKMEFNCSFDLLECRRLCIEFYRTELLHHRIFRGVLSNPSIVNLFSDVFLEVELSLTEIEKGWASVTRMISQVYASVMELSPSLGKWEGNHTTSEHDPEATNPGNMLIIFHFISVGEREEDAFDPSELLSACQ